MNLNIFSLVKLSKLTLQEIDLRLMQFAEQKNKSSEYWIVSKKKIV